jgi:competence protein ComEA
MFAHIQPKERIVYILIVSAFVFGAAYVGAQRMRKAPDVVIQPGAAAVVDQSIPKAEPMKVSEEAAKHGEVVVDVEGAVRHVGVEKLPAGSRVDDAIKAAGGFTEDADREGINLAAKLQDGQQVKAPKRGEPAAQHTFTQDLKEGAFDAPPHASKSRSKKALDHQIDLSTASYEELQELPGVGPAIAEKLLQYRLANGHLTFEDLEAIPGLGPKKRDQIKPWVR